MQHINKLFKPQDQHQMLCQLMVVHGPGALLVFKLVKLCECLFMCS